MNRAVTVFGLGVALLVSACATTDFLSKSMGIHRGDERAKVIALLGQPQDRQFIGPTEALQYCGTSAGPGHHSYLAVILRDGRVTTVDTYQRQDLLSSCRGLFKTIRIDRQPERVADVR